MWPTKSPSSVFRARRARLVGALGRKQRHFARGVHVSRTSRPTSTRFGPTATFSIWWADPSRTQRCFSPMRSPRSSRRRPIRTARSGTGLRRAWMSSAPISESRSVRCRSSRSACARSGERWPPFRPTTTSRRLGSPRCSATSQAAARARSFARERPTQVLADAFVALRLTHDEAAIAQMRQAAAATAIAHGAGMRATRQGIREAAVMAAMVAAI